MRAQPCFVYLIIVFRCIESVQRTTYLNDSSLLSYMDFKCPLCGKDRIHHAPNCPLLRNMSVRMELSQKASQDFFGAVPNVFVGRYGYPDINVGLLTANENKDTFDSPQVWVEQQFKIPDIIDVRSQLVNSSFKAHVKKFDEKLQDLSQEISLSQKPVDVEVNLAKKPDFSITFGKDVIPYGPNVPLVKARITENPKIPQKVQYYVDDPGVRAAEAITTLAQKGFDQHYLTKVFSVGNLGTKLQRKLVPTRWSITAVDDTLGKDALASLKECARIDGEQVFVGHYLGNYFIVLLMSHIWSYELFEFYAPAGTMQYTTDFEFFEGRKTYVEQTAGGYYASRLPIISYLQERHRQASVLVLRFVTSDYYVPLGVWVVREAVKNAMKSQPMTFADHDLAMKYVEGFIKKKFNLPIAHIFAKSKILRHQKEQLTLQTFIS
jgi:DNA repair protein NreA